MIKISEVESIVKKYGLNPNKIAKSKIVYKNGNYDKLDENLDYLINHLRLDKKIIENCLGSFCIPSIFQIRRISNLILKNDELGIDIIRQCPSILSSGNYNNINKIIEYVKSKYGLNIIYKCPSILAFGNINNIISITEYIEKESDLNIIRKCPYILVRGNLENIKKIVMLLKEKYDLSHLITGISLISNAENVEKILEIAEKENILKQLKVTMFPLGYKAFYAELQFLKSNSLPVIENGKRLNPIFTNINKMVKQKYGLTRKEIVEQYYKDEEDKMIK